jgi:hypothetical protein
MSVRRCTTEMRFSSIQFIQPTAIISALGLAFGHGVDLLVAEEVGNVGEDHVDFSGSHGDSLRELEQTSTPFGTSRDDVVARGG